MVDRRAWRNRMRPPIEARKSLGYTVPMLVARRLVISGRVQGVGFRFFAEDAARREGVAGWVTNRHDGAVEVLVEGDRESVDRFEGALRRGPRSAKVDRVVASDEPPSGQWRGFSRRD
jgi:acylphosphatase